MPYDVAKEVGFKVIRAGDGYMVHKEKKSIGFTTLVDRAGKLNIIMSSRAAPGLVSLGEYTLLELQGQKAKDKMAIKAKLLEL